MVKVILFLIIAFMLSLTLNVALTAVLYRNWVDNIYINKKSRKIGGFMKKGLKICFSIIGVIVILGIAFFVIDYNRVKKQEKPIFCIKNPAGIYRDGGTIEYFGLGYKVIDFNTSAGFDDIKIGTWFMDYNDFEEERNAYEKKFEENLQSNEELNRSPENVTIEVDNTTVRPESVSITITDNNVNQYGWGVEFRVQQKVNEEWEDLQYVSDDLAWIDIAYEVNEDHQLTLKLDIEQYYGKLSNGIYRIVKPVYDNGYIDIYSNEFEIK